jgi:tripartite-type tricarboxylate transporter receptor subunit TctC
MKPITKSARLLTIVLGLAVAAPSVASAADDSYPNRPISFIFSWGPGGFENAMRVLTKIMEQRLGQPIVFETKSGSSGLIGARHLFKSEPDGYTIGEMDTPTYVVKPFTMDVPFDPAKDSRDICGLFKYVHGYAVRADAPWKSHKEVIEWSRKNPGKFRYAVSGLGTGQHLAMEWISNKEGAKWSMVPFKSGGEAALAALGGHVDAVASGAMDILPLVKAGKMRLMLGLNDNRWADYPDVPNMSELGYGYFAQTYISLSAPKGLPDAIASKLQSACRTAVEDPAFQKVAKDSYFVVSYMHGAEYRQMWLSQVEASKAAVKAAGLAK